MNLRRHHKLAALAQSEEFVYRNATGLVALTPLLVEDIRTTYRVETPATVAPDGVDLEQARTPVATTPARCCPAYGRAWATHGGAMRT